MIYLSKMVIFHTYVSSPEGIWFPNMTISLVVQLQCRYVAIEGLYPNLSVASRIHQKTPKYARKIDDTSV